MSKRANPTLIGGFILLGVALALGGITLFGSAKLFRKTVKYILYFDASVKGLNPGAPVKFRGVTVGSVHDVMIRLNQAEDDLHIPVIIELDQTIVSQKSDRSVDLSNPQHCLDMIHKGLRGRLQAQSLVTGLLYVELEVLPNAPPPAFHQLKQVYQEIPTAPTQIQELMGNLAELDLKGITEKLNSILDRLDSSLGELHVRDINEGMTNLLASLNRIAKSRELNDTLRSIDETLSEFRLLSKNIRSQVDPLAENADETLRETTATMAEIRRAVQNLNGLIGPRTALRLGLLEAVEELGRAARSISELAESLKRNPNALITGRKQPQ